jgi:hypothetical protein
MDNNLLQRACVRSLAVANEQQKPIVEEMDLSQARIAGFTSDRKILPPTFVPMELYACAMTTIGDFRADFRMLS